VPEVLDLIQSVANSLLYVRVTFCVRFYVCFMRNIKIYAISTQAVSLQTRMWSNAQRDGRPAEQEAPSVQRRKVWLTPTTRCRAITLPRRETRWNLQRCPKLANTSKPLVGRSLPYCGNMWRRCCCLTSFFSNCRYVCLSCEYTARQSCAIVPRWQMFGDFCVLHFSASRVQHISDLYSKFTLRPHRVWK